ncbi:hypothetical protein HYH03_002412 [Edaphochlamys debaryana]|uniref:MYND-type domain-containing protein n=1 Tax=Edaphochlamys debaryana TaxID=47281 RepID=A0A836C441_9CHLO|nr:hypothetical protein HYH03_002412 [Edaphochlamys debaryana]|eukprot:KAG2499465.1 hypothetical protein HYH03_002412 [Edaphochlamys debaryana]
MAPSSAPGNPGPIDALHPDDEASVSMGVRLTQVLLSTQAVPRTTAALQAAAARLQAAAAGGTSEGDGQYQHVCGMAGACLLTFMLAGRTLRRTATATFRGKLAARTPVPGGGGATVADGAAALLYQLTAPELAAALAGVLDAMRRRCAPAAAAATSPETITRALEGLTGALLDPESVRGVLGSGAVLGTLNQMAVIRANVMNNACAVVYEILACSYLTATLNIQQFKLGGGGDSLLGAASAFPPAAAAPAAGAATAPGAPPGLPNLLVAHRRLLSSLAASSLVDVMAGAVLALPPPPAGVPYGAAAAQGMQTYLREIKHVICCSATSISYLATIGHSIVTSLEQPPPGDDGAEEAPAAAAVTAAEALAHECAALLSAPRVLWLQRALLERWLMDQAAAVAEAARTGRRPRFDASANDADADEDGGGGGGGGSCGVPLLDRVSVVRLVRRALGPGPGARLDAEKDDSALATAMLTQTDPLLCTLLLLRSGVYLSGAGAAAGAAAAPLPSLARAPECAALLARVMEAACRVVRAGGSLGMQEWSLRVVKMAGAVLRGMWRFSPLTPASELLDAVPSATEALWWGLGAVVAETRRPGDPNALSVGGASSYGMSEWESISATLLGALEVLVTAKDCGLRAIDAGARAALSSRLSACGWLRTAHSLLRLHAARRPEGAGDSTIALTFKLLPFFLHLDPATASAAAPTTAAPAAAAPAASAGEVADLLLTLSKLASRAALRAEQAAASAAAKQPGGTPAPGSGAAGAGAGAVGPGRGTRTMALPALTAAQRALDGPQALVEMLELLAGMQLAALRSPALADPGAEAGAQAAALRSAQAAFLRGYVRAAGALAGAWRPLLAASLGLMRTGEACVQARRPANGAGLGMPEARAVAASLVGARVVAEAVAAAAACLDVGLRQGWLAAPPEQPAARLEGLLGGGAEAAAVLAQPAAALALEGERAAGGQAVLALVRLLMVAGAQEELGPQVAGWLRPVGEGGSPDGAAAGPDAGRLAAPAERFKAVLEEAGAALLAGAVERLLEAARAAETSAAEPGAEGGAAAFVAVARALQTYLGQGPEQGAEGGGTAAPPAAARVCSWAGCDNFAGESEAALRLQRCGGCGAVRYCSTTCQRADWAAGHKAVCKQAAAKGK